MDVYHSNPEFSDANKQKWSVGITFEPKGDIVKELHDVGFELTQIPAQKVLKSTLAISTFNAYGINAGRMYYQKYIFRSKSIVNYAIKNGFKIESSVVEYITIDDQKHMHFMYFPQENGWLKESMDKY